MQTLIPFPVRVIARPETRKVERCAPGAHVLDVILEADPYRVLSLDPRWNYRIFSIERQKNGEAGAVDFASDALYSDGAEACAFLPGREKWLEETRPGLPVHS